MSNKTVQQLLRGCQRGHPIDSAMLREMGISNALAAYMVRAGWLQRLSQGVYLLTGDAPSLDGAITYLPGGQFKFPHLWARKFPHLVKQDEIVI